MNESSSNPLETAPVDMERFPLPLPSATSAKSDAVGADGPDVWDDYEIIDKLGAGGMGTVWRARLRTGGREVALKQLNAGLLTSEAAKRRFQREVEITSLLEHPNIARVYESGVHHGDYFYAMELIEGISLDTYVERNLLDHRRCLSLISLVCRAIQYAHQKAVIHRDLKPSNILVDGDGNPHVVDFGMGKLFDEQMPFSTISMRGEWVGTPAYMSPEQAAGLSDEIGPRSDIYGLGVILYQLITKRLPHEVTGGNIAIMERVVRSEIIRPRIAAPGIDRDVEAILLKSLARRPEDRYATAGDMAEDMDRYLRGDPLKARRPTVAYFLRKRIVKHRISIAMATTLVMLLVGTLIISDIRVNWARSQAFATAANAEDLRHFGQVNLAYSTLSDADALANEGRWNESRERYWDAYRIEVAENISTLKTRLRLLDAIRQAPYELSSFFGNIEKSAPIDTVFDPTEFRALVALADGTVQSYDLSTGHPGTAIGRKVSEGQSLFVFDSPDRNFVYRLYSRVGTQEDAVSEIQKFDLLHGTTQTMLQFKGWLGNHVEVSPDGRSIVATGWLAHSDKVPKPWGLWLVDASSAANPQILTKDAGEVRAVSRSSDLRTIVIGDSQGNIRGWDAATRDEIHLADAEHGIAIGLAPEEITCLKYAPDDSGLLVSDIRGNVRFISLSPRRQSRNFNPSGARVVVLGFSHDGQSAFSGDVEGVLRLWNVSTGELCHVLSAGTGIVSAQVSTDDRRILVRAKDGSIHVWPIDGAGQSILYQCREPIGCIAISPDNLVAAVGTSNGLEVVDIATGHRLWFNSRVKGVITVAFSSSGSTLDVATTDGAISRFEVYGQWREAPACSAGTTLQDLSDIPLASAVDRAFAVLLSPVSDHAIALSRKGAIVVDVAKGERIRTLGGSYLPLGCFSSDGQTVFAIATRPIPSISSINVRTGVISNLSLRKDVQVHCTAIDISPDSKIAYLGYDDGTIHAIDIHSASDIWSLACGGQIVKYLKVSADGTTMLSSGDTGVLQLWNLNEHAELKNVVLNLSQPAVAAFSPRGDTILFSRPSDDAVCMWDTTLPKRLLDEESQIGKAREQLATDPTNAPARANIMSWFEMLGAYDWANHLLDEGDTDANLGIEAARCRWRVGNLTAAVEDFNALIQRGGSGLSLGYLRACRDAAARGE